MGQPAKPIDPDYDPVLAAMKAAPYVPSTEQEIELLEEAKNHPGPPIPHAEFMRFVASLRPADATDDDE